MVATAQDNKSFHIYYYGGYDGLGITNPFYDDVWVLSLPSFVWTQLNRGTSLHARAGHKCFVPYPDQMLVVGGYTPSTGTSPTCLDGGVIVNFKMSSGEWLDGYDPTQWSSYTIPTKIQSAIGAVGSGGASVTSPLHSGWAAQGLADLFNTKYDTKKIEKWWPYEPESSSLPINPGSSDTDGEKKGSGLPQWVAPVLGAVLGLMLITGVVVLIILYRSRRLFFKYRSSDGNSESALGRRILSWMRGQHLDKRGSLSSSDESDRSLPNIYPVYPPPADHAEMADDHIAELDGMYLPF